MVSMANTVGVAGLARGERKVLKEPEEETAAEATLPTIASGVVETEAVERKVKEAEMAGAAAMVAQQGVLSLGCTAVLLFQITWSHLRQRAEWEERRARQGMAGKEARVEMLGNLAAADVMVRVNRDRRELLVVVARSVKLEMRARMADS